MALTYSARLDVYGNPLVSSVLASDGAVVLTGLDAFGHPVEVQGDAGPTEAYRAWLAAGGVLGAAAVTPPPPRQATTYQLMIALTDAQRAAYPNAKAWDQRLFSARDTPWPETNEKVARIATVLGTTPEAWFDIALAAPAAA